MTDIIRHSFARVKQDILLLRQTIQEWARYLDGNQKEMQQKIEELESRIKQLELQVVPEDYRPKY